MKREKMGEIYMECYLAMRKEILLFVTTWVNLKIPNSKKQTVVVVTRSKR